MVGKKIETLNILVTGGAGFIGSCFLRDTLAKNQAILPVGRVVNLDKLTYAGNLDNLTPIQDDERYVFHHGDIGDKNLVSRILQQENIAAVVHFAAETHVDRSILHADDFLTTNLLGTGRLLESCHGYWRDLPADKKNNFRFLHISTDEVFGSLTINDKPFDEDSAYRPNSPYAASKAGADHLVRSYYHTHGFPSVIVNCTNNYGPYQFPEKFIPMMITRALMGEEMPVYGKGENIRDWLYVQDHVRALMLVLAQPIEKIIGQVFGVGGLAERDNLSVAKLVANLLDKMQPKESSYAQQIKFVADRPGHDVRYAMDIAKIKRQVGFAPQLNFEQGLSETIAWYLQNQSWTSRVMNGDYQSWLDKNYTHRK